MLDRLNGSDEALIGSPGQAAVASQITDDGRVVAFRELPTGGGAAAGWFELEAAGTP